MRTDNKLSTLGETSISCPNLFIEEVATNGSTLTNALITELKINVCPSRRSLIANCGTN